MRCIRIFKINALVGLPKKIGQNQFKYLVN